MKRGGRPLVRTYDKSAFASILEALVSAEPGCEAAALVDPEGETVDVGGSGDEYDMRVAAAHWRIVLAEVSALPVGGIGTILIETEKQSYLIRTLAEGYALVLVCAPRAAFRISTRALEACSYALLGEAGLMPPRSRLLWRRVEVAPTGSRSTRPERARLASNWHELEVLGLVVGLRRNERGYRVRLANGAEITLVREPLGRWWADDSLD